MGEGDEKVKAREREREEMRRVALRVDQYDQQLEGAMGGMGGGLDANRQKVVWAEAGSRLGGGWALTAIQGGRVWICMCAQVKPVSPN
jgi:hypothetical protein